MTTDMTHITAPAASAAARSIIDTSTVVDMVFVYENGPKNDFNLFPLYREAGVDFIQCHPAGDNHNISQAVQLIASFRRDVLSRPDECVLVETVADIHRAKAAGRLAVGLQLEGFRCLERNLDMIETYYRLGVRLCHPIHNITNSIGGGCADGDDLGLTQFGLAVVAEMNRVGMIVDGTHCGHRVQLDMIAHSASPPVFSHHGVSAVRPHIRNLKDDVIDGCAARGGVMGITGAGFYMGGPPSTDLLFRHIDHIVQRVGPDHVGLALDYFHDFDDQARYMADHPGLFPGLDEGAWDPVTFTPPTFIAPTVDLMMGAGYGEAAILAILGGNWLRVCEQVWK